MTRVLILAALAALISSIFPACGDTSVTAPAIPVVSPSVIQSPVEASPAPEARTDIAAKRVFDSRSEKTLPTPLDFVLYLQVERDPAANVELLRKRMQVLVTKVARAYGEPEDRVCAILMGAATMLEADGLQDDLVLLLEWAHKITIRFTDAGIGPDNTPTLSWTLGRYAGSRSKSLSESEARRAVEHIHGGTSPAERLRQKSSEQLEILATGILQQWAALDPNAGKQEPKPEETLAFAQTGQVMLPADDPLILRFRELLTGLSARYAATPKEIHGQTLTLKLMMQGDGAPDGPLEIMESLNAVNWTDGASTNEHSVGTPTYLEAGLYYTFLRKAGYTATNATVQISDVARKSIAEGGPFLKLMTVPDVGPKK